MATTQVIADRYTRMFTRTPSCNALSAPAFRVAAHVAPRLGWLRWCATRSVATRAATTHSHERQRDS